jgi:hypothetical protein
MGLGWGARSRGAHWATTLAVHGFGRPWGVTSKAINVLGCRNGLRLFLPNEPDPPGYPGLLWATRRRFDPSSPPSARLAEAVFSPDGLFGN